MTRNLGTLTRNSPSYFDKKANRAHEDAAGWVSRERREAIRRCLEIVKNARSLKAAVKELEAL